MSNIFRFITIFLWCTLSITVCFGNNSNESKKLLNLAENMEEFGYHRSAKHYYKQAYKHPATTDEQRKTLDVKIIEIDKKIKKKTPAQKLPNLTNISHYNAQPSATSSTSGILHKAKSSTKKFPSEFPKSRINKTKWIITTVAIIGLGLIIHKQISDEHKHVEQYESNTVSIGF